ncbi:hypothetical protein DFS34DRAFT_662396 [Phlyctochytrium arcticum]|nr:hypothetical protein DFS34DRAFT_662396 [Phlyctochytrium arcticum]
MGLKVMSGSAELPCRIKVRLDGLEWFIYNRTPAYEALKKVFVNEQDNNIPGGTTNLGRETSIPINETLPSNTSKDTVFRWFLPIEIAASVGAITFGQPDIPSIIICKYKTAAGIYEAVKARSVFDFYRTILNLSFRKVQLTIMTNVDYREPVLNQAARMRSKNAKRPWYRKVGAWLSGNMIFGSPLEEQMPFQDDEQHWTGLSRYHVTNAPLLKRRRLEEYAKVTNVLDCTHLEIRYYADVPGPAPASDPDRVDEDETGNGDLPPEWGFDVVVTDSQVTYGPWADRQRKLFQSFFFPTSYRNLSPTVKLRAGDARIFTATKILVQLKGKTTLRLPIREQSKDWKFYDDALTESASEDVKSGTSGRPYAWIDIKSSSVATVDIVIPFVQTAKGYTSTFGIALEKFTVSTSLNYAPLLEASNLKIDCQMPNPIEWKGMRTWTYSIQIAQPRIFFLRDHEALLSDLVKDWTTGPRTCLSYFIPMRYCVKLTLTDFDLYLCVNQNNVINNPNDLNDNVYLLLSGPRLKCDVTLPFLSFEPQTTLIDIQLETKKICAQLSLPPSNTYGAYFSEDSRSIGKVSSLCLGVAYRYHTSHGANNVDQLALDVKISGVQATIFGIMITHLMYLKENYLGEFNSFMTSEEFLKSKADPQRTETNRRKQDAAKGKSNSFEVSVVLVVTDATALLPRNLYATSGGIQIQLDEIYVDSRNTDFYHDVDIKLRPILLTIRHSDSSTEDTVAFHADSVGVEEFSVRSHRLFGLPPRSPVYAVDWRFNIGVVSGDVRPVCFPVISDTLRCFMFSFTDQDNIIGASHLFPDITTVYVVAARVELLTWIAGSAISLEMKHGLRLEADNLVSDLRSRRTFLEIPHISIQILAMPKKDYGRDAKQSLWIETARFNTAFSFCIQKRTTTWQEEHDAQMEFVRLHDEATKRCGFLYKSFDRRQDRLSFVAGNGVQPRNTSIFLPKYLPPFQLTPTQRSNRREDDSTDTDSNSTMSEGRRLSDSEYVDFVIFEVMSFHVLTSVFRSDISPLKADQPRRSERANLTSFGPTSSEDLVDALPGLTKEYFMPYRCFLREYRIKAISSLQTLSSMSSGKRYRFQPITSSNVESLEDENYYMERPFNYPLKSGQQMPSTHTDDKGRTFVTVHFCEPLRILLTPVTLNILADILEDLNSIDSPLDVMLDRAQTSHTERITSVPPTAASLSALVSFPAMHIHCIQDMLLPDPATFVNEQDESRERLAEKLVCSFDLVFSDVNVKLQVPTAASSPGSALGQDDALLLVDIYRVATKLRYIGTASSPVVAGIPVGKQHFSANPDEVGSDGFPVVLDVVAEKIRWHGRYTDNVLGQNSMTIKTRDISVLSMNETIEIMFGTVHRWTRQGLDYLALLKLYDQKQTGKMQILLHAIAELAHGEHLEGDPLFLTQPSALWLLGKRAHQSDSGWRLLAHLRYCLQALPAADKLRIQERIHKSGSRMDSQSMYVGLLRYLGAWRQWEVGELSNSLLLRSIYSLKSSANTQHDGTHKHMLCWKLLADVPQLNITIIENQSDDSSIGIGPVSAVVRSNISRVQVAGAFDETLDIKYDVQVDRVSSLINPNLFGFIRHCLRVYQWFQLRSQEHFEREVPQNAKPRNSHTLPAMVFGNAEISELHLTATAHNLVAETTVRDLQLTTAHVWQVTSPEQESEANSFHSDVHSESLQHSTVITALSTECSMYERNWHSGNVPGDIVTMISLNLFDIGATFAISGEESALLNPFQQRLVFASTIREIEVKLPRSLLKLHSFMEKWGDEELPRYDFLFSSLVEELEQSYQSDIPKNEENDRVQSSGRGIAIYSSFQLQFSLQRLSIQSDLLTSLSVIYDAEDLLICVGHENVDQDLSKIGHYYLTTKTSWEARLGTHKIEYLTNAATLHEMTTSENDTEQSWTTFELPMTSTRGRVAFWKAQRLEENGEHNAEPQTIIELDAAFELYKIQTVLNVSLLDQLMTTQNILGGELNDVLDIVTFYKQKRQQESKVAAPRAISTVLFNLSANIQGLQLSSDGPGSMVALELEPLSGVWRKGPRNVIIGELTPATLQEHTELEWSVVASRISATVIADSRSSAEKDSNLGYAIARITTSISAGNQELENDHDLQIGSGNRLRLRVHKLFAMFRPNSVKHIMALIAFYTKELDRRKGLKSSELQRAKANTRRLLTGVRGPNAPKKLEKNYFEKINVILDIDQVRLIVSLRSEESFRTRRTIQHEMGNHILLGPGDDVHVVPAAVIEISSVRIRSKQLKRADGGITDLTLQFVPSVDLRVEGPFTSTSQGTLNRILLREAKVSLIHDRKSKVSNLRMDASVTGFEFELDASISEYINQMNILLWEARIAAAQSAKNSTSDAVNDRGKKEVPLTVEQDLFTEAPSILNRHIKFHLQLIFNSGTCKLWSNRNREKSLDSPLLSTSQLSSGGSTTQRTADFGSEETSLHTLNLPTLTLIAVGRTSLTPLSYIRDDKELNKAIHIELLIHESFNTLQPDILTLFREIQAGLRLEPPRAYLEKMNGFPDDDQTTSSQSDLAERLSSYTGHKMSFVLRLSQTKVVLSCHPISKVTCTFNLGEVNAMLSFQPHERQDVVRRVVCGTVCISAVSGALRHSFSPEDCLNGEFQGVDMNITMADDASDRIGSLEINLPSIKGNLNARHLQDLFFFQKLWMPKSTPAAAANGIRLSRNPASLSRSHGSSNSFIQSPLPLRTRQMQLVFGLNKGDFGMDLGQAIGKSTISFETIVVTGRSTQAPNQCTQKEATFQCKDIRLKGEGRLSGNAAITGLLAEFQDRQARYDIPQQCRAPASAMLFRVQDISAQLYYQYERILILQVAPLEGNLSARQRDNESDGIWEYVADFETNAIKAITSRQTIPTMIDLLYRIRSLLDEKRSLHKTASAGPSNTTSPASNYMSDDTSSHSVQDLVPRPWMHQQDFTFHGEVTIGEILLILTRFNFRDPDFAQVACKSFVIQYSKSIGSPSPAAETTELVFERFNVKKGTAKSISQSEESMWTTAQWFAFLTAVAGKNVFGVPRTVATLLTARSLSPPADMVEFSFRTQFGGPIDVALNFGLYKYLQELMQQYNKAVSKVGPNEAIKDSGAIKGAASESNGTSPVHSSPPDTISDTSPNGKSAAPISVNDKPGASSKTKSKLTFQRRGNVHFEPQLKVTGDATPWEWVEWLGVHKEKLPLMIFENLTVPVGAGVNALRNAHDKYTNT